MKRIKRFFRSRFTVNDSFTEMQKSWLPDKYYIKTKYKQKMHKELDLNNPKTFNEKLQWLKLFNRKPEYTIMVDKYAVKQYVREKIGDEHIIPLIGVWDSITEIDFDMLPNQFVLKCTHDGGVFVCKDKKILDIEKAKTWLNYHLKRKYYKWCREWPYKNVKPRIIAEKYIQDDEKPELRVYKLFCFNGVPALIQMITGDKTKDEYINYYDTEWNLLNIKQNFPNGPIDEKPLCLKELLNLSSIISDNIPFVRTDFYIVNGNILFSEYTFFSDAGFERFHPDDWDYKLGALLRLPDEKRK